MKHLLLDANNLLFRARHSCYQRNYENVIVHAFFRSLKPIIEKFSPDYVYFVLDGYPKKRMEMRSDYKGTRVYHDKDGFLVEKNDEEDLANCIVKLLDDPESAKQMVKFGYQKYTNSYTADVMARSYYTLFKQLN